jgi:hypothetical protein
MVAQATKLGWLVAMYAAIAGPVYLDVTHG